MSAPAFRAITTRYKGYNFRSRLEARWAVFFDHLGIRWDYEPEGFELGNGLRYLPDFWLPDLKLWVEVKPGAPDDAAKEKAWRLARHTKFMVYMTNGLPDQFGTVFSTYDGDWLHKYERQSTMIWSAKPPVMVFTEPNPDEEFKLDILTQDQDFGTHFYYGRGPGPDGTHVPLSKRDVPALEAARGARFEFGAKGGL